MNINIKQLRQLIKEERAALQEQDARTRGKLKKAQRAARKKAEREAAAKAAAKAAKKPPGSSTALQPSPYERDPAADAAAAAAKAAEAKKAAAAKKEKAESAAAEAELRAREEKTKSRYRAQKTREPLPEWAAEVCFNSEWPDDCVMMDGALYRETDKGLELMQTPDHDPDAMAKWTAAQHEKVKGFKPERVPGTPLPGYFAKQKENLLRHKRKIELDYQKKLKNIEQGLKKLEDDILEYAVKDEETVRGLLDLSRRGAA